MDVHLRALVAFFNWLQREGYTTESVASGFRRPKIPQQLIDPLNDVELAMIYSAVDADTEWGARDIAILTTFLDTGLRLNELATLTPVDVHLEEGYLKVMGKGRKERIVPVGNTTRRVLMRYLYHYRPEGPAPRMETFFLNVDGDPISREAIRLVIKRIARKSKVNRLHPHLLRHTFAVRYVLNGGDVFSLQQILGHTTLEMVRKYVNLANSHLVVKHREFSPVDRLNVAAVRRVMRNVKGRRRRR